MFLWGRKNPASKDGPHGGGMLCEVTDNRLPQVKPGRASYMEYSSVEEMT